MISTRFLKTSIIYTMAGALPTASAIILLPVYVLYLPLDVYGALSICLAISLFVQIMVTLSFDLSVYIHYHDRTKPEKWFGKFVSSAMFLIAIFGIVVVAVASVVGFYAADSIFSDKKLTFFPYGFLAVLSGVCQAFFKVYASLLQSAQQPQRYLVSNLVSFGLIVLLTAAGLWFKPASLMGPVGGRAVAAAVSGGWAIFQIFRTYGVHFDLQAIRATLSFNASSYLYQLQQWLINYLDRIIITFYLTLQDVGAYDFAFKCLLVIELIIGGLYNSFQPKVLSIVSSQDLKHSTPEINRYYHGLVGVTMILVVMALVGGPILFEIELVKSDYLDALVYIPMLSVLYLVKSVRYYFNFPYGALRHSKPLPLIYIIILAIKVGLMLLLIEHYGVRAVILSAIVAAGSEIVLLRFFIRKRFEFRFNPFKLMFAPAMLAALIFVVELVGLNVYISAAIYAAVCFSILWFLYGKELRALNFGKLLGLK